MKVVIIGGGAAGASCATRLRRLDNEAEIIILEKSNENSISYCNIPYYIGNIIKDKRNLQAISKEDLLKMFNIEVRLNKEVAEIIPQNQTVITKDNNYIYYDILIIAVGLQPLILDIKGLNTIPHFTVKTFKDATDIKQFIERRQPQSAVILGAGFIGIETAENLQNQNIKTTIIDASRQILPQIDKDIAHGIENHIQEKGVNLILNKGLKEITPKGVMLSDNQFIPTDMVILSTGMYADIDMVKRAAIQTKNNSIVVNEYMQTNFKNIYACGDSTAVIDIATGIQKRMGLAGPASRQGRLIADHIAGQKYIYKGSLGAGIVKVFDMTVAFCGNTEAQLKENNIDYQKMIIVGSSNSPNYPDSEQINLKVLYDEYNGKIFGAQAAGKKGIDKRIDVIASIMRLDGTVEDLRDAELCYAPPYSGSKDIINLMGMAIQNARQNLIKPYFDNNFEDFFVLDIRSKELYKQGHLPNAKNIPFTELKSRLSEIPQDEKILIHCTSGRTSYKASRLLIANGFKNVYSYAGGWQQYLWQEENPKIAI